ncbi:MAG: adenylate/guanylate cyclase domain-containing protein [Treponema sp.]|jgi:adenylate cyclase|nr:adenylate/guanylate cyclase domain-containing protein [Treponema sp.]
MKLRRLSLIIAFASVFVFSLLHLTPAFRSGDYLLYDFFLRLKPNRKQSENIVFLNVDDAAIASIGVFPWPRSVIAEGFLRLKEYEAQAVILDIEYIDKSPTKVDEAYLRDGLARDYNRHFSEISTTVAQILNSIAVGRIPASKAASYIDGISELIADERDALYKSTLRITGDDDRFLAQAAALFGNTWGTLNLQEEPLAGEQAQRRAIAEERFAYPVTNKGIREGINADLLLPIPLLSNAVKGAGFTNINPDPDGVRRRISLVQEVHGLWYLQLAFAPLMDLWGNPPVTVEPHRLIVHKQGEKFVIPLDSSGYMMLDWPKENYRESYTHISFYIFDLLESYLSGIESYLQLLALSNSSLFPVIAKNAAALQDYFSLQREVKHKALEECSSEAFYEYIALRDETLEIIKKFTDFLIDTNYIENESQKFIETFAHNNPELVSEILEEARYCSSLLEYLNTTVTAFYDLNQKTHEKLYNKVCIVGRTDTGTTDIAVNPFHSKYINVGTHAVVYDTILANSLKNQLPLKQLPFFYSIIFSFLFVPLVLIGISDFKHSHRSILGFAGIVFSLGLPLLLFITAKIFLAPLTIFLAMTTAVITRELFAYITSEREKRFIRRAFSTYISSNVVAEIIEDPSKLNLGGESREMTAIFTDLKSFTTFSESMSPPDLVRMLNIYLTKMSNVIMVNHGTIDKYIGDAIIAFFGAPIERKDHAALACLSALEIKEAEKELNVQLLKEGLAPVPLFTRIGINTGEMLVGNMGSETKMNYTVMGHEVNLASRLEGVNNYYQSGIIISEFTKNKIGNIFLTRKLDHVRVKGILRPVLLHELIDLKIRAGKSELAFHEQWNEALIQFELRNFSKAETLFADIAAARPHDGAAALYLNRSKTFIHNPPSQDWDGIFNFTEK